MAKQRTEKPTIARLETQQQLERKLLNQLKRQRMKDLRELQDALRNSN